ncbi:type II toxin-antitoxin system RelE/ParE family toxin [Robertmurraya andreesenii]|uniref:type II toxin-antitoxin system RelE/ParE family toxin n=1 Tax=Anoxybacillus andreesenii TaxID=1325932 RepID=UPI0027D8CDA2|nr:type II toxin-antitoxin system RelE/ParE family toxin [Robertmurraya andreesenii]
MERILKKVEKSNSKLYEEFIKHQEEILKEPSIGSPLKGDLKDLRSLDFKFQQVSLRICYQYFEGDNHIIFVYFGTRENFYKDVKRYLH